VVKSGVPSVAEELLALAMSRPIEARARALGVLDGATSAEDRAVAMQALGIVAREQGELSRAIRHFRMGLSESEQADLPARRADLQASLAHALVLAGRRSQALDLFTQALSGVRGVDAARILVRRSAAFKELGEDERALSDARHAVQSLRRAGERHWQARALINAAHALLGLGRFVEADRAFAQAQLLEEQTGQDYVIAIILHNRADCSYRMGDLPRALGLLHSAYDRYAALGVVPIELLRDRVKLILAAGLVPEAVQAAEELTSASDRDRSAASTRADCLTLAATALLEHDPDRAQALARRAVGSYRRQGHRAGEQHARLVELRAFAIVKPHSAGLARAATAVASDLHDRHASERLDAYLLAGQLCADAGLTEEARAAWLTAADSRRRGSALRRAASWLARARLAQLDGDRGHILRACDAGLDVLEAHARSLGSTELRASATAHGRELAGMAVREVLHNGSGRDLLRWTERWRATVLDAASPLAEDAQDVADLAALRDLVMRSDEVGVRTAAVERERAQLEERIRRRAHSRSGRAQARSAAASVSEIVSCLQPGTALVAISRVDGVAHVVAARNGRVHRFQAGSSDEIDRTAEFARFALRSAATGDEATAAATTAALEDQAGLLQELLLGPAVRALGDGPVVVVPPATLQSIPWVTLPALRDRPVSVSPSASAWLRSCQATQPRRRRVALVTGPRLESAGAEVPQLARTYERATVLGDGAATCDAAMKALDGAWLAHVAAHGIIRTDNPMFSALELDDGPLTVYDLERLHRAPYRLVLSVCESAVGAATGADELLGLSSALIGLGTAGLLASIVQVNDEATVPFSLTIHERLRAGDDLATALMHARRAAGDDPVARATAYSFLALGAA
jgi:CHAT domain-containing protein/tetratricopeptide (TPR) repeat protein